MKVDSSNSLYTIIRLSMLSVLWWYYGLDRFVMLSLCHLLNLKNVSENVIFNYDRETSFIFAVNYSTLIMFNVDICSEWYDNSNLIISRDIGNFSNRKSPFYSCRASSVTVFNKCFSSRSSLCLPIIVTSKCVQLFDIQIWNKLLLFSIFDFVRASSSKIFRWDTSIY